MNEISATAPEPEKLKYLSVSEDGNVIPLASSLKEYNVQKGNPRDIFIFKRKFLESFLDSGMVSRACRIAGISHATVYRWKRSDLDFAREYDIVGSLVDDKLEDAAVERALGFDIPLFDKEGNHVGNDKVHSDPMLMFLLRGRRREKYGTEGSKFTASVKTPDGTETKITWSDIAAQADSG